MKIYLASPWFCKSQAERETRVKEKLRNLGFEVHSPKEDSNITGSIIDPEYRRKVFENNVDNIKSCDIIFGITDGKRATSLEEDQVGNKLQAIDPGTIFECGYAYSLKHSGLKDIIIIYYAETLGSNAFNLMLQESADIVITSFEELNNLGEYIEEARKGNRKVHNGITE